jgi:hypothetical protein
MLGSQEMRLVPSLKSVPRLRESLNQGWTARVAEMAAGMARYTRDWLNNKSLPHRPFGRVPAKRLMYG